MSYVINFSSGLKTPITVTDNTLNTSSTSLTIIGKSRLNWGETLQENSIFLLENFDSDVAPGSPTTGQLWSDNLSGTSRRLRFYDLTTWKDVLVNNTSAGLPGTGQFVGQLWNNTSTNTLHFWNSLVWKKIDTDSLPLSGGTMTGAIISSIAPTLSTHLTNKSYVDTLVGGYLLKTGGTMTGAIISSVAPTLSTHLTNKNYVDGAITTLTSTISSTYLPKSGGTLTGLLTLSAGPSSNLHAATKKYVDDSIIAAGSGLGYVPVNRAGDSMTGLLTLSGAPSTDLQAATKKYVDDSAFLKLSGGTVTGGTTFSNTIVMSGVVNFTNASTASTFTKLPTSSATPSASNELVTKTYVDTTLLAKAGGTVTGVITYDNAVVINNDYHLITRTYADSRYLLVGVGTINNNLTINPLYSITSAFVPTATGHVVNKLYADGTFFPKAGGTLTGFMTLHANPTNAFHAATKNYVDSAAYLPTAGGTVTGVVNFTNASTASTFTKLPTSSATPSASNELVTKTYVDEFLPLTGGTLTGLLTLSANPSSALHASTKGYVDDVKRVALSSSFTGFYSTDFINGVTGTVFSTTIVTTGIVSQYTSSLANTNGMVQLSTDVGSSGAAEITDGYGVIIPDNDMYCLSKFIVPIISTAPEEFKIIHGLVGGGLSNISGTPDHELSFIYDRTVSANWLVRHRISGSTISTTTTSIPVTINTICITKIKYVYSTDTVTFYVDGVQAHQIVGASISAGRYGYKASIAKSNGTTARTLLLDNILYGKIPTVDSNWNLS